MSDGLYIPVATSIAVCMKAVFDSGGVWHGYESEPHVGFCLGEYDEGVCFECPVEKECLELRC
jgi:hypothetical protein